MRKSVWFVAIEMSENYSFHFNKFVPNYRSISYSQKKFTALVPNVLERSKLNASNDYQVMKNLMPGILMNPTRGSSDLTPKGLSVIQEHSKHFVKHLISTVRFFSIL